MAAIAPALPPPGRPGSQPGPRLSKEDIGFLDDLSSRLQRNPSQGPTPGELERVETLFAGSPDDAQLKEFLVGLYFLSANQDLRRRAFPLVEQTLARLKFLDEQPQIYAMEAHARGEQQDWTGLEEAVLKYERLGGEESLTMSVNLALSLLKQGRQREVLGILDRPIFASCPTASAGADLDACGSAQRMRALVSAPQKAAPSPAERPREALVVDEAKAQIQSDRFDVRFDGEAQSGVARDVLFVLDRAYVRLKDIYYDQPVRKIPVVLHSSQDYFSKTGAPWWSGGVYSSHTGAIQIPIRGLPSTLPREMEDVLVHELSHAFVDERAGGRAGRDLQEGLAQYMEGKRIEEELGSVELKRLANARSQTVTNFYMLSLVVAEQMVQSRGQGMVNQLLKAMKDGGSEDAGFKKVFGQSGADMKKEILATFWRRYS